jgi:hypothetical protein
MKSNIFLKSMPDPDPTLMPKLDPKNNNNLFRIQMDKKILDPTGPGSTKLGVKTFPIVDRICAHLVPHILRAVKHCDKSLSITV